MAWSHNTQTKKGAYYAPGDAANGRMPSTLGPVSAGDRIPSLQIESAPPTQAPGETRSFNTCISTVVRELRAQLFDASAADVSVTFRKHEELGKGSYGCVWRCEVRRNLPCSGTPR